MPSNEGIPLKIMKTQQNHFSAVIFDLDGVITDTAAVHSASWKKMFDDFLQVYATNSQTAFRAFSHEDDYLPFVDGKPRNQGVSSFLDSRGIEIPLGDISDPPELETIYGLGNRKNEIFNHIIAGGNFRVFTSTVEFIHQCRKTGIRVGVASSSKNCGTVLEAAELLDLFETRVDGIESARLGLKGKPEPDIFTTACQNLGVTIERTVIVEDAVSGVQAGRKGNFGLVLGIARESNAKELKENGADLVVTDMAEISFDSINEWFATKSRC
jgi:beta-phosphoglucomutase family hydrolase